MQVEPDVRTMPDFFGGLEWKDATNVHPMGVAALIVLGVAALALPRRWAMVPIFIMACFIPSAQKVTVLSCDFSFLRLMVVVGWIRVWSQGEMRGFEWKPLDKVIVLYAISGTVIETLQIGSASIFIFRLGASFDILGTYFLFRHLIRDWQDVDRLILGCIVTSMPVALLFLVENATGHNLFSIFGGIREVTLVRDDRLRCVGAIGNPIDAGCFWAALMPLFAARWWRRDGGRYWAIVGVATSLIIVYTCASSTPVMGVAVGIIGGLMFYCRRVMRTVRWVVLLCLVALHMVMKAPVWHLIGRVSAVGGSTSYFRFMLIDSAINHFGEWWLIGTPSTAHWFWGAQDVCNHYVLEGITGGLLTLALFVAIIVLCFQSVGRLWRKYASDPYKLAMSWAVGVCLFVHCAHFIGIAYTSGAILVVWFLPLAIAGSLAPKRALARYGETPDFGVVGIQEQTA